MFVFPFMLRSTHEKAVAILAGEIFYLQKKLKEHEMPTKSKAQKKLMQAAAHNPKFAKKVGVPTKVAKEFLAEDKKKKK